MTTSDLAAALRPVQDELNRLGINFYIGGSVASSFHGAARSTLDVDLIAELDQDSAIQLCRSLIQDYYLSEDAVRTAIQRTAIQQHGCFNLIHLPTSFKVDIFVSRRRPCDVRAMSRCVEGTIADSDLSTRFASVEDTILAKLEWYRLGNESSERQWDDLKRVSKINDNMLDRNYLEIGAVEIGVADLLARLLIR